MTETPSAAAKNPVLYTSVTALSREHHKAMRLKPLAEPLAFGRGTHLLPAVVDEFASAARELPIVFLPEGDMISPVFLLGLRSGHNGFITPEGLWTASYMPAYMRRYPFILGEVEGSDPVLCFDERFGGINDKDGEALFQADGASSPFLEAAMKFAAEFREAGQRTAAFVAKLKSLSLFKSVTMDVKNNRAGQATIHGLLVVDEEKLRSLPDNVVVDLHRLGVLPAIYAHLLSLGGIANLT
ncbi:MAG: SapC family protein [Bosea sp. (in: a-proteobacteria)]